MNNKTIKSQFGAMQYFNIYAIPETVPIADQILSVSGYGGEFNYNIYKRLYKINSNNWFLSNFKDKYLECRKESQERWNKRKFNRLLNSSLAIKEEIKKKNKI